MNKKGFTLLEVLIAVTILAVMSMMIWQITNNTYRGTEKASVYDKIYQHGRVALKKLVDDLSMSFLIGPSMQGKNPDGTITFETSFVAEDQGETDTISFVSFSNIRYIKNEKKSDIVKIAYSVGECKDVEEKTKCLNRKENFELNKDIKDTGTEVAIAYGVKRFNLEFYDSQKQEWRSAWSSTGPEYQNKLPRAVRITIAFNDPKNEGEEIAFTTDVMLPLSTGPIEF